MKGQKSKKRSTVLPPWTRRLSIAGWLCVILLLWLNRDRFTLESILSFTPESLWRAALIMLLLFALKSISVVFYCGILYIASGILFPMPLAIAVNVAGTAVMAAIPYSFGRRLGADAVQHILERYPKTAVLRGFRTDRPFLFTFLIRAISILPLDVVSVYLGACQTSFGMYLLGSVAGMLNSCVLFPILGENITAPGSWQFILAAAMELLIIAFSLFVAGHLGRFSASQQNEKSGSHCV